ncbi:aspartate--ammonia ligase [Candidatus Aminicenantes bacterium AC-334-K16]|jgi:aspartate--ammonia ligase|nr:aspartate--ammonia ligase [Candidatus Aminicenantes bacterium AC-334-K16]
MATRLILPPDYKPALDVLETEKAIMEIKLTFQRLLAEKLNLQRVTAPLFVQSGTGINDDLNGIERPLKFSVTNLNHTQAEIVQSLAKWKRLALAKLKIPPGKGIYTDMNAIRPDEILDNLHSIYVDQWDWERVITPEERSLSFLKEIVSKIYQCIFQMETIICQKYPQFTPFLPPKIHFIHAQRLQALFPQLSPREREDRICKTHGAVFIQGIGLPLTDGQPHDGRAPDYDDWTSPTEEGPGLNGDILIWYPPLQQAFELSSMGIRVDAATLLRQLKITGCEERRHLYFHRLLLEGKLPLSIGGGIGQSRLCMFLLRKVHIGEVQVGIWDMETIRLCEQHNITLL